MNSRPLLVYRPTSGNRSRATTSPMVARTHLSALLLDRDVLGPAGEAFETVRLLANSPGGATVDNHVPFDKPGGLFVFVVGLAGRDRVPQAQPRSRTGPSFRCVPGGFEETIDRGPEVIAPPPPGVPLPVEFFERHKFGELDAHGRAQRICPRAS